MKEMDLEGVDPSDIHLDQDLLAAIARGQVAPGLVSKIAGQHLFRYCSACKDEILTFRRMWRRGRVDPSMAAALLPSLTEVLGPRQDQEEKRAWKDLQALMALDPAERVPMIQRARSHFRGSEMVRLLLHESDRRLQIQGDLAQAEELAGLAREVLEAEPGCAGYQPLRVLVLGALANLRRAKGDLPGADGAFEQVRELMRTERVGEAEVKARIDELEGSLRKEQRRFQEAEELLARAELFYQMTDDWEGNIRALLKLGITFQLQGKLQQASHVTRSALRMMSPGPSRFYLSARYCLASHLTRAGDFEKALAMLKEDEERFRGATDPAVPLRVDRLRGEIAEAQGDETAAEEAYRKALEGFLEQKKDFEAVLAGLHLAGLYLRQGKSREMKELAERMIPVVEAGEAGEIHCEALALLQDVARGGEITVEQLRTLIHEIQEARVEPEY